MRKFIYGALVAMVLVACAKEESRILSQGDKITRSIGEIDSPLLEVLQSAHYWDEIKTYTYSEPNGEGEEVLIFSNDEYVEFLENQSDPNYQDYQWKDFPYISECVRFTPDRIEKYLYGTRYAHVWHYYDFEILKFEDNIFTFMRNNEVYYLKVLAYNENYIWIETDCYDIDKNYQKEFGRADTYPYVRMLLRNPTYQNPDTYFHYVGNSLTEDEMLKDKEETQDKDRYAEWP